MEIIKDERDNRKCFINEILMTQYKLFYKLLQQKFSISVSVVLLLLFTLPSNGQDISLFRNNAIPIDKRVSNLLSLLTLKEKISLLGYNAPAVPRLGIPSYNWWNEALSRCSSCRRGNHISPSYRHGCYF